MKQNDKYFYQCKIEIKKIFNSLLLIFLINIIYKGFLKIKHENLRL